MGSGESVLKVEVSTQTEPESRKRSLRPGGWGSLTGRSVLGKMTAGAKAEKAAAAAAAASQIHVPDELRDFTTDQILEMIELYKDKQTAIDRSSIRGSVTAKRDLYNALNKNSDNPAPTRPRLDLNQLHRQNAPKGYLTKITTDYEAKHDEELSVQKGTMVKVLRNHKDGRYEIYTAGGFGLVPGKILAYIQYEPDYQ